MWKTVVPLGVLAVAAASKFPFDIKPPASPFPLMAPVGRLAPVDYTRSQDDWVCTVSPFSLLACGVSCQSCVDPTGTLSNSTCIEGDSHKAATAQGGADPSSTIAVSLTKLFLQFDATADHHDCACATSQITPIREGCNITVSTCGYFRPGTNSAKELNSSVMFRTRVFDTAKPEYTGASQGWEDALKGISGVNSGSKSVLEAVKAMRGANPSRACNPDPVPPLVIVPGLPGSNINFKLDNSKPPVWAYYCPKNTDGFEALWPLSSDIVSSTKNLLCWDANVQTQFDNASQSFEPLRPNQETELVDFGGFDGINGGILISGAFEMLGWTAGEDLFASPYDWRLPSVAQSEFFDKLQKLVEQVSAASNGSKVVLWGFSFGPQYAVSFLHRMTQAWKDKYISWFIGSSPVWSGAPAALLSYATGEINLDLGPPPPPPESQADPVNIFTPGIIKTVARGSPSFVWTFPRQGDDKTNSYTKDDVLLFTPSKNYTAFDTAQLLVDLGVKQEAQDALEYLRNEPDLGKFASPGVDTFITYGFGLDTTMSAHLDGDFKLNTPKTLTYDVEDGDGLVSLRASLRTKEWETEQRALDKKLFLKGYVNQAHAQCFPGVGASGTQNVCGSEVLDLIVRGIAPSQRRAPVPEVA